MKKLLSTLGLLSLTVLPQANIIGCKTSNKEDLSNQKVEYVNNLITEEISDKKLRFKSLEEITNKIKDLTSDLKYLHFNKSEDVKQDDIFAEVTMDTVYDKEFKILIKYYKSYKSKGKYSFKESSFHNSFILVLKKLENVDNITVEKNFIENTIDNSIADLKITNYNLLEEIYLKPIENKEQFVSYVMEDKKDYAIVHIAMQKREDKQPIITKFNLTASNAKNDLEISVNNIYGTTKTK